MTHNNLLKVISNEEAKGKDGVLILLTYKANSVDPHICFKIRDSKKPTPIFYVPVYEALNRNFEISESDYIRLNKILIEADRF